MEANNIPEQHQIPRLTPEEIERWAQGLANGEVTSSYLLYLVFLEDHARFSHAMKTCFLSLVAQLHGELEKAYALIEQGTVFMAFTKDASSVTEDNLPVFLEHTAVHEDDHNLIMARVRTIINTRAIHRNLSLN